MSKSDIIAMIRNEDLDSISARKLDAFANDDDVIHVLSERIVSEPNFPGHFIDSLSYDITEKLTDIKEYRDKLYLDYKVLSEKLGILETYYMTLYYIEGNNYIDDIYKREYLEERAREEKKEFQEYLKSGNFSRSVLLISNLEIINFIIDEKMYNLIDSIILTTDVPKYVEDFIIEGIKLKKVTKMRNVSPNIISCIIQEKAHHLLMANILQENLYEVIINQWYSHQQIFKELMVLYIDETNDHDLSRFLLSLYNHCINDYTFILDYLISKIPFNRFLNLHYMYLCLTDYKFGSNVINNYVEKNNITSFRINNFLNKNAVVGFIQGFSTKSLLAFIRGLNRDELIRVELDLFQYKDNTEILEVIFERIAEDQISTYNSQISSILPYLTPKIISIITSPDNPLKINYNNIYPILGNMSKWNFILYEKLILRKDKILLRDLRLVFNYYQLSPSNSKECLCLIEKILLSDKFMVPEGFYHFFEHLLNNTPTQLFNSELTKIIKKFYLNKKNVPLKLSFRFGFNVVSEVTFKSCPDEYFLYYPYEYFECENDTQRRVLFTNLREVILNGKVVCSHILISSLPHINIASDDALYSDFFELLMHENVVVRMHSQTIEDFKKYIYDERFQMFFKTKFIPAINDSFFGNSNVPYENLGTIYGPLILAKLEERCNVNPCMAVDYRILRLIPFKNETEWPAFFNLITLHIQSYKYVSELFKCQKDYPKTKRYISELIEQAIFKIDIEDLCSKIINDIILNNSNYKRLFIERFKTFSYDDIETLVSYPTEDLNYHMFLDKDVFKIFLKKLEEFQYPIDYYNINAYFFNKDFIKTVYKYNKDIISICFGYAEHDYSEIEFDMETMKFLIDIAYDQKDIKEKIYLFIKYFGKEVFKVLKSSEFKTLLSESHDDIRKFLEIIKNRIADENTLSTINYSLQQLIFSRKNTEIITIYPTILAKIQNGLTLEDEKKIIEELKPFIPNNISNILVGYDKNLVSLYSKSEEEFLQLLFKLIKMDQTLYSPILKSITDNYIVEMRNEYAKKHSHIRSELNLDIKMNKKSFLDKLFSYIIRNPQDAYIFNLLLTVIEENKEMLGTAGNTNDFARKIIDYLRGTISISAFSIEETKTLKIAIKLLKSSFYDKYIFLIMKYSILLKNDEFLDTVKFDIVTENNNSLSHLLSKVNHNILFKEIMSDTQKYSTLIGLLDKYKFLNLGDIFEPILKDIMSDSVDIFAFLNSFNQIYMLKKKNCKNPTELSITPYDIFKYALVYSFSNNYHKLILGIEDEKYIRENPSPNASSANQIVRLDTACELQLEMMKIDEVTIPSFIEDISLFGNKMVRVTVGNRSDSKNLTHGERTGACMRVFGHAHDLFKFCLLDKRGFHIVFTNPENDNYVSRISGFRNGNAVVLNQLRYSTDNSYDDADLILALKKTANMLIELSKDSPMPIELVIASNTYVLRREKTIKIKGNIISEGVYSGYRDVTNNAVLIASSFTNEDDITFKPDADNQPIYKSVRLLPIEYREQEIDYIAIMKMNRISCLARCLTASEDDFYKTLDVDYNSLEKTYYYLIIGEDFFVALDTELVIHSCCINDSDSMKKEYELALNKIENFKAEKILKLEQK